MFSFNDFRYTVSFILICIAYPISVFAVTDKVLSEIDVPEFILLFVVLLTIFGLSQFYGIFICNRPINEDKDYFVPIGREYIGIVSPYYFISVFDYLHNPHSILKILALTIFLIIHFKVSFLLGQFENLDFVKHHFYPFVFIFYYGLVILFLAYPKIHDTNQNKNIEFQNRPAFKELKRSVLNVEEPKKAEGSMNVAE